MKTIPVGKFKANCLSLLNEVARTHEMLVITKYGKPVVRVIPFNPSSASEGNPLKDSIAFQKNIVDPIDVEWSSQP